MKKIEVKNLPEIPNICNQKLKEVWKSKDASVAYVEMDVGNTSLLHFHMSFTELYYILDGRGIMEVGGDSFYVEKDNLIEVSPNVYHRLMNTGDILRHLVISVPAFNSNDVRLHPDEK